MKNLVSVLIIKPETFLLYSSFLTIHVSIVEKRIKWEELRKDYASQYAFVVPMSLRKKWIEKSNYSLSRDSLLSDKQLALKSKKRKGLFSFTREARTTLKKLESNNPNNSSMVMVRKIIFN